jgi:2-dehydropantoate 2-reductase
MKIAIIGAGALGSLFGGLLSKRGEVWLYNPSFVEHVTQIKAKGLILEGKEKQRIWVRATPFIKEIEGPMDLVGIFVKAYATEGAIKDALPLIGERTWVLSLQNGLGSEEIIAKYVDKSQILRGVTSQGATLVKPGRVRWAGSGPTKIGRLKGEPSEAKPLIEALKKAGIETCYVKEGLEKVLWEKLIVNAAINPLTAIFECRNGKLIKESSLRSLMAEVIKEGVLVAQRKGLKLNQEEMIAEAEDVCRKTAENISSMLQDIKRERRTEIDYINGAIVREGKGVSVETPLNRLLFEMIRRLENE